MASFDAGIERALQRILADPEFVFRKEAEPANLAAGKTYRISDLELASRLSFFLWSSIPDDELINSGEPEQAARSGGAGSAGQRMLADPKSDQLVVNFAGQWLNLRGMQPAVPDPRVVPGFGRQSARGDAQGDGVVRRQRGA